MRMSDWSSDVCSSDLSRPAAKQRRGDPPGGHFQRPDGQSFRKSDQSYQSGFLHPAGPACRRGGGPQFHLCIQLQRLWRCQGRRASGRSEEHTSELRSLMRISYAVFCLKKKTDYNKYVKIDTSHTLRTETLVSS